MIIIEKIKIAFLDVVGLRYDGDTLNKRGLGGSESATIYMSKELQKLGFDVTVFCKVEQEGVYDGVKYISNDKCANNEEQFDILVTLRSCIPYIPMQFRDQVLKQTNYDIAFTAGLVKNSKYKVLWLHDTFCTGDDWLEHICLDGFFDEIFTLSDWHTNYILNGHTWRGRYFEVLKNKVFQTRNGIKNYIKEVDITQKDENLFVYNASVSKGMIPLLEQCWPKIKKEIPDARLKIVGGFYRGANNDQPDEQELQWMKLKEDYDNKNGVMFTGIISQEEIAHLLAKASLMIYPSAFPETFGISTLEALNYNTPVVTCRFGALEETAIASACYLINYDISYDSNQVQRFINEVLKAHNDTYLRKQKMYACNEVKSISTWDTVALQWKQHFYNKLDLYLPNDEEIKVEKINKEVQRIFKRRFLNKEDVIETSRRENTFLFISPVYNAEKYIEKCIRSVANQSNTNYRMFIIDDMSTDNTYKIAKDTINSLPKNIKNNFHLLRNVQKKYAVTNQVETIDTYHYKFLDTATGKPLRDEIIVLLDGDDWLANDSKILDYLDNLYYEDGYDMTYGSCHSLVDNIDLIAEPYPKEIIKNKSFRQHLFAWGMPITHLRTFRYSLFEKIDPSMFKDENGENWKAGGDNAIFYPLLENAKNIKCIQRVLMVYNDTNPLNDYKIHGEEQTKTANKIRDNKPIEDKDIHRSLYDVHQGVVGKDEKSIAEHKDILKDRTEVWIDNTEADTIRPRRNWMISKLKGIPFDAKILDIGAWTGKLASDIHDIGYQNITCLEISEECVKMGKENFPFLTWIQGDVEQFITDQKFDVVLMGEVIEHLVYPFKAIDKVKTWLNDNGFILYTIPTEDTLYGRNGTPEIALEHISSITENDLRPYSKDIEIIKSEDYFNWYAGSIRNNMYKTRILIALPTAKNIEADTFKSIYNLEEPKNCELAIECFYGYNIDQVRNLMVHYAVQNNFDYVFCVDSDIVLPRNALVKLLSHKKDIVSGIYRQRVLDQTLPEIYINGQRASEEDLAKDQLLEVDSCGFGCTLITTELIKKIGYPQFVYHSSIDFKDTVSEDTDFCIKARERQSKVYVDTSIRCGHIGNFELKIQ